MNISDRARQGFDRIVEHCMRTTLVPTGGEVLGLATLDAPRTQGGVVMLTLASSTFSLVLFLQDDGDAAARARVAGQLGVEVAALTDRDFQDALAETRNLFCGALNRELGRVFPLVGMSTPGRLEAPCVAHLRLLRHGHVRHFRLDLADGSQRHASYCVCAYGDVDFNPPAIETPEEMGVGELEFF